MEQLQQRFAAAESRRLDEAKQAFLEHEAQRQKAVAKARSAQVCAPLSQPALFEHRGAPLMSPSDEPPDDV